MGEILVEIVGKFKTLHSRSRREVSTSPACQGGTEPGLELTFFPNLFHTPSLTLCLEPESFVNC